MRSIFTRFIRSARPSRRRGVRRREVFSAQFDGGQSAAMYGASIHLGCDVLEQRVVLTASGSDFDFSQGTITGYKGAGGVVDIPSIIGGVSVTAIGENAFRFEATITSIVIPDSVKTIGTRAFADCSALTSLKIGSHVTSIGDQAFSDDILLKSVVIPSSVTTIGADAFAANHALTSLTIGNHVTSIGEGAFKLCHSLKSVSIPNSVRTMGNAVFSQCTALESLKIGNHVTSIGYYALAFTSLKSVVIPNSVNTIGPCAFFYNTALTSLKIGSRVTSIGDSAFEGDTALKSVTFTAKAPTVGSDAFKDVPFGAKAVRAAALPGYGPNGTLWNGLIVWKPGVVAAPTVTVSTATLAHNAATMTIKGTGFVAGKPSAHQVTFSNGAEGMVMSATATKLTVMFTKQPTSAGALTAIVTSVGGKSGVAKQVATVNVTHQ